MQVLTQLKKLDGEEIGIANRLANVFGCYSCEPDYCQTCADIYKLMLKRKKRKEIKVKGQPPIIR